MTKQLMSRIGAACGVIFPIMLVVSNGNGTYSPVGEVLGGFALALAIPFICYLTGIMRSAGESSAWLRTCATGAGIGGIVLKFATAAPMIAIQREHIASGSPDGKILNALGDAGTVASLFPLAIFGLAVAVVVLRTRVLPAWLGVFAAVTGLALAVNACFLETDFVPALLLFAAWSLVAGSYLTLSRRVHAAVLTGAPAAASA